MQQFPSDKLMSHLRVCRGIQSATKQLESYHINSISDNNLSSMNVSTDVSLSKHTKVINSRRASNDSQLSNEALMSETNNYNKDKDDNSNIRRTSTKQEVEIDGNEQDNQSKSELLATHVVENLILMF